MIRTVVMICLSAAVSLAQNAAPAKPGNPWKALEFLTGTWEAQTQAGSAGAASTGMYSFGVELRGHVMARHSSNGGCAGPADFNCEHADLLYIYPEDSPTSFHAIYFDNEGHVIHYAVTSPAPGFAVFLSDASKPGPRYRLTYELKGVTMYGKFQIQMPGEAGFQSYLEWSGAKRK